MKLIENSTAQLNKRIKVVFLIGSFSLFTQSMPSTFADDYEFDPSLLLGIKNNININQLHDSNYVEPGDYDVDIYINNRFIERKTVSFQLNDKGKVTPCFTQKQIEEMGLLLDIEPNQDNNQCLILSQFNKNIVDSYDASNFRITITVPQILLKRKPQGYVNEDDLDAGNTMLFSNYSGNYYKNKSNGQTSDYGFGSINMGVNLGTWQFRQQASYSYNSSKSGSNSEFNWIRTYLQKPLLTLKSR